MTTTDTSVNDLIINQLTQAQFDTITPNPNELYMVTDGVLSSSDVTDALGYTPYNATNPNGYTSNIGTVTKVNNTSPDSNGNVSIAIPTVNNATLTIQKNGTNVQTFTANSSSNKTANIIVPTNTNELTNGAGFITGITSTDVTTALGYTPYDSSNPSGYTTNTGTVTSVNNVSPTNGNVSLTIPSGLGDLSNVSISSPSAGQNLTYDATNQVWKNTSTSATVAWGGVTGTLSDQTDLANALGDKYDASNPDGFISGITSTDVTTALGYTPYDSSNPSGYTTNTGTVTSVNNVSPVNGNVTLSIPDAQIQSDWNQTTTTAKDYIKNKPTIPSEVTESTVSGWGFTKNAGTVTSVNNISPTNGNVSLTIPAVDQTYNSSSSNAQSGIAIANAGFLTNTNDCVHLSGAETITGQKTFNHAEGEYYGGTVYQYQGNYKGIIDSSSSGFNVEATSGVPLNLGGSSLNFIYGANNYQLLTGTTGLIPDARLSSNIARVKDIRNIGEIVTSTIPLTDAGLHLLDGSLLQYASYKDFIDYIASIYNASLSYFCTEADWQTAVTNYGVCGKFVYNSTNNTVRLPKITGFIEGASGTTTLGDVTGAGLPNITGSTDETGTIGLVSRTGSTQSGAFTKGENRAYAPSGSTSVAGSMLGFDASLSNSIYGNSNTVQPQSTKVLYYIVIANTTKTAIEVDIDEIATDLNGKADTDLSNVANTSGLRRLIKSGISGSAWYKIYSEYDYATGNYIGLWAECGDLYYAGSTTAGDHTIAFPFVADDYEFKDTNYVFIPSVMHNNNNGNSTTCYEKYTERTKTTAILHVIAAYFGYAWTACGYVEATS